MLLKCSDMIKMVTAGGSVVLAYGSIIQILSRDVYFPLLSQWSYRCDQFKISHVCSHNVADKILLRNVCC
jgi:hypothetical protein